MNEQQLNEFFHRLDEKCNFHKDKMGKVTWECSDGSEKPKAREVLKEMNISEKETEDFLLECEESGGYCDCEIILNCPSHFLAQPIRTEEEICDKEQEFFNKVWYNRHLNLKYRIEKGEETCNPDIWEGALKSAKKVKEQYGHEENFGNWNDWEYGYISGKLAALRWVLGEDDDMLDT